MMSEATSSFADLMGQAQHRRTKDVRIERDGGQCTYELTEIRSDVYMRMAVHGSSLDAAGETVYDQHRLQAVRIILALSGASAIPGETIDEKIAYIVQTDDGPKPAIDFIASLPRHIFEELNEGVEEVCSIGGHKSMLNLKIESLGDLWMIVAYCAENKICFSELGEKGIYMSQIAMWHTFWEAEKTMEKEQIESILSNIGASTADRT